MRVYLLAVVVAIGVTGCWAPASMTLKYANAPRLGDLSGTEVAIGQFADRRGTASDWLGAVRGGFGNALKVLNTEGATSDVVAKIVGEAVKARGGTVSKDAPLMINGTINRLDASQYMRREAHVSIEMQVVESATRRVIYSVSKQSDKVQGAAGATGAFGSRDKLAALAEDALTDVVDQLLGDAVKAQAFAATPSLSAPSNELSTMTRERLRLLDDLRRDGQITDDEYQRARERILKSL